MHTPQRRVARRVVALLALALGIASAPGSAVAEDDAFTVVVFEGRGLGHGLGLPLDGANAAALEQGANADTVLDRFFPGTGRATRSGIVRVLVATRDDLEAGIDIVLPRGGTIRDGRTTPVAPSFPIRVSSGDQARISFAANRYRAEVIDDRSISGTVEITPTTSASAATATTAARTTGTAPGLGASERSVWIIPDDHGSVRVEPEPGAGEGAFPGPVEVVVEAERLHIVAEISVETYLSRLDLSLPDGTLLTPTALDAAVIAARSYALRAAQAAPRVGEFHLYADDRSLPYAAPGASSAAVRAAVDRTRGRILTDDDGPAAALLCTSAGGTTAVPREPYGPPAQEYPYLSSSEYGGGQDFTWRVDIALEEMARDLGYDGDAEAISIARRGPSGRATALRIFGTAGDFEVGSDQFHPALRLPSSRFEVRTETRTEPLAARDPGPPFQEPPGEPLDDSLVGGGSGGGGSSRVPLTIALGAGATLVLAFVVLLVADVQRRMRRYRERRAARLRRPITPPDGPFDPTSTRVGVEGPTWHNEPEWLSDLFPDGDEQRGP